MGLTTRLMTMRRLMREDSDISFDSQAVAAYIEKRMLEVAEAEEEDLVQKRRNRRKGSPMMKWMFHVLNRWMAQLQLRGPIWLSLRIGVCRCVFPNGHKTRWMHYSEAKKMMELHGGRLEWRGDVRE